MAVDQRFIAERLHGDGTAEFIHWDLPVADTAQVTDALSSPPQLTAQIDAVYAGLKVAGRPLLEAGSTAIYFEEDGVIRGGWLLADPSPEDQVLHLDGTGFCGYPNRMDYTGEYSRMLVDPADVLRDIWAYVQSFPNGNLGLVLDTTTTPVRVGVPGGVLQPDGTRKSLAALGLTEAPSGSDFKDDAPYTISWFNPDNLGSKIADLAKTTPLEFHEEHSWNAAHTAIDHFLRIGYPTIGNQRDDLRFVLGENIDIPPRIDLGAEYANEVTFLGAGEGRDMIRTTTSVNDGRLRQAVTVTDKRVSNVDDARTRARAELNARQRFSKVDQVIVRDMPEGASGLVRVGDTIRLQAEEEWTDLDQWVRVLSIATTPLRKTDAVMEVMAV